MTYMSFYMHIIYGMTYSWLVENEKKENVNVK